ncbi:ABC transporter substrate-binding protein, partial [uncultured Ruthenibacterium sp.]|uniref:ABC transporter substrate-binding protein n=1 Tax=uncultured Ruthenibacterium sp. TaxID=1905347 RepID=UPI00349ECDCF
SGTSDETPADGSITLTVSMPLGQWTDNFDTLIESYMADHPEIAAIDATFPSSDKYQDLLKSALSAGELPDIIISVSYGLRNQDWFQYCVDLSTDCPAYDLLTDDQKALGTADQGMIIMPIYVEGTGILYNMRLLEEAGWDHTPQTRDELAQLCADLTAAGIKPFMHQWSETYLNLFNWVGTTWLGNKDNQMEFLEKMLAGEDMDLANDKEWNDFMDTYEILIEYAQEGAIATDKWTCRNAFFLEECAMLVGEGSWETPNIESTNPALLDYVKQDVLPCSNEAGTNKLQTQAITASVTDSGDPARIKAAKDFLSYIVSSEDARIWHQEKMGSPTAITSLEVSENLPAIAQDVMNLMAEGKNAESLYTYMPSVLQTDLEKIWAEFVGQQITRDEFTEQYQQIFKDYADGKYN